MRALFVLRTPESKRLIAASPKKWVQVNGGEKPTKGRHKVEAVWA